MVNTVRVGATCYPCATQKLDNPAWIERVNLNVFTVIGEATKRGAIGLAAHWYTNAGRAIKRLQFGDTVTVDGTAYRVTTIETWDVVRGDALQLPEFADFARGAERLTGVQLLARVFRAGACTFMVCEGWLAKQRIFVVAEKI